MRTFLTLDVVGLAAAVVLGALIFVFGGAAGPFMLALVLLFLVSSSFATGFRKRTKERMRGYERARGWKNVLANGLVPLLIAVAFFINIHYGLGFSVQVFEFVYAASIAAITADKFSSELGVFDKDVIMLATLRKTRPGISGGVSFMGTVAGAIGAAIISMGFGLYAGLGWSSLFSLQLALLAFVMILVAGLAGNLVDSFLGYFEDRGLGNKYTSNFACAVAGAAVGLLLFAVAYLM